jgi:hypothetical protein
MHCFSMKTEVHRAQSALTSRAESEQGEVKVETVKIRTKNTVG